MFLRRRALTSIGTLVSVVTRAQATRNSEVAYDRQSHIGKLDKAWDEAVANGWPIVSMKGDLEDDFPSC
jgi:hypothetical protein